MAKQRKTTDRVVISCPAHEIALGLAKKQIDLRVGGTYDLAPHCDLWMRGAKTARVKRFYLNADGTPISASVVPIRNGYDVTGTHYVVIDHFA
jgi:hypothetical protein